MEGKCRVGLKGYSITTFFFLYMHWNCHTWCKLIKYCIPLGMIVHCTWDVGYLPVSQRVQMIIKESLEHVSSSTSDSLELFLKFSLFTTSSFSLNYLHWIGKQQEGYTRKTSLYTCGFLNCTGGPYQEDCICPDRVHYYENDRKWIE